MVDIEKIKDISQDEGFIELLKEYGSPDSMKNVLKELLDYAGASTQLLTDSAVALSIGEELCKFTKGLLNLLLEVKSEENAEFIDDTIFSGTETIDLYLEMLSKLNQPTKQEMLTVLKEVEDDGILRFG